jgi:hypothetical protein
MTRTIQLGAAVMISAGAAVWLASVSLAGQSGAASSKPWSVPRLLDGHPDLQGFWTNATITPLERPNGFTSAVLTEAETARLEKQVAARKDRLSQPSSPDRTAPPVGGDGSTGAAGNVGGYNNFWIDAGDRVAVVNGERRSSLITDPPDGKVPPTTEEARKRLAERAAATRGRGAYDHPEMRPLAERCILSFGPTTPMIPNYFYNNNYQIVQTPDHVMILMEMVHDARIVRMGGQHLPSHIRVWMGDSIGRWEGDTLVIDTTNFPIQQPFRGAAENLHVVERLTRVGPDSILYKFTVEDPTTFTRSWGGEIPFRSSDEPIYEYACHEGNYALGNILRGERQREREAAAKKQD